MYYSASILRAAGFTNTSEAIWLAAVVAFFNLMGAMSALYFVEKFGRRPLTLNSLITVIFSLLIIAFAYYLSETSTEKATNNSAVSGSCSDYEYCFDCIQDTSCAFCSQLVDSLGGGSACIDSDDDDRRRLAGFGENNGIVSTLFHSLVDTSPVEQYYPATTPYGSSDSWNGTCASSSDYYDGSCPGSSFQGGWMIFVFLCVYLVCFSSGMGKLLLYPIDRVE